MPITDNIIQLDNKTSLDPPVERNKFFFYYYYPGYRNL